MKPVMYPDLQDSFSYWLAGYFDGEGHFGAVYDRRPDRKGVQKIAQINARADEYPLFQECQLQTGLGNLVYMPAGDGNPCWGWVIRSTPDCLRLIEISSRYALRSKKAGDFAIWAQIVREVARWKRGGAAKHNDHARVQWLIPELIACRQYNSSYEKEQLCAP